MTVVKVILKRVLKYASNLGLGWEVTTIRLIDKKILAG